MKNCSVEIIDDSLFEDDEEFSVYILPSMDTVVSSKFNKSLVIIRPDVNDGKYDFTTFEPKLVQILYIYFARIAS